MAHDVQTSGKMRNFKCSSMWYIYLPLGFSRTRAWLIICLKYRNKWKWCAKKMGVIFLDNNYVANTGE